MDRHLWCQPMADGNVRIGLTPVAYWLLGHSLIAIAPRSNVLGREVPTGRSVVMVESLKYNGPVAAPFAGTVVRVNEALEEEPERAAADPYGDGWIVEMRPVDWAAASAELLTGETALAAYRVLLANQNITNE
ncbi:MAG: glycine cleavage system protein H [Anaerolineae bacterium]